VIQLTHNSKQATRFHLGLFRKLPEPKQDWPSKDRLKWLQIAANIFDLACKGEGGITVSLARAERSPRHVE